MNQYVTFNFATVKNERVYQMVIQPGSPWEDIEVVLHEFQNEFALLKEQALKQEAEKTAEMDKSEAMEPEVIVNEEK